MSSHQAPSTTNGPNSAGIGLHQGASGGPPVQQNLSQPELNKIVLEYLNKKGYQRTEKTLRMESSRLDQDGRPIHEMSEDDPGAAKYIRAFDLLLKWIENNLDINKFELNRLVWPVFVYSFLNLVKEGGDEGTEFFDKFETKFTKYHAPELRQFSGIRLPLHVIENPLAKIYMNNQYALSLNDSLYYNLITFLDTNAVNGGKNILYILATHCKIHRTSRGIMNNYTFESLVNKGKTDTLEPEGIPGAFTGVSNQEMQDSMTSLRLGMVAMEPELAEDVRAELEDEDVKNPPRADQQSLVEVFDANVKREDSADGPLRNDIPYPPSRARDVAMEVQKIKENRDRFRIDGRTGGIGTGISVIMYTFHNTYDCVTCIEFSQDYTMIAVGTDMSYIRVWNMDGSPLPSIVKGAQPSASRKLIGHSASCYSISFSPGSSNGDGDADLTKPKLLLSCSSDATIRLWSLQTWTCLVTYKGHSGPVWNVQWSPFGHYFASVGHDRTARVWAQDHVSPLRLLIGHDDNVNNVCWHPNGAYLFTSSDNADKSIRMWSFVTGEQVRSFVGHTEIIHDLQCSPSGRILASSDFTGTIILWDIAKGTVIKRCRGHKSSIWSMSFSAESTALVSGGQDGTVRVWDVELPIDPDKTGEKVGAGSQPDATRININDVPAQGTTDGKKKKVKDTTITPDQISAFPTKKSPVYKVKFTRTNMVMSASCFMPQNYA